MRAFYGSRQLSEEIYISQRLASFFNLLMGMHSTMAELPIGLQVTRVELRRCG